MEELLSKSNSNIRNSSDSPASVGRFIKTVELKDWWLIKAVEEEGSQKRKLGVAGFTNQRALRAFISAPILKTHDVFTLETVDGITVKLSGLINKQRTKENGFPDEVFDHFVIGIPSFWEMYVEKFFEGGSGNEDYSSVTTPKKLFTDFEDLGEFHDGTPKEYTESHSKSTNTNCDNVDLNQAGGESTLTKRVQRSSNTLSDATQCLDNYQEAIKNSRKCLSRSKATNCNDKGSSPADENSKNTTKILRSDAKQSNGFNIEDSKNNSNAEDENANPTNCQEDNNYQGDNLKNNRKRMTRSKAKNSDGKGSSPVGEDNKNTKRILRSCSRISDAKQSNGFNVEDSKKKSNAKENANSKKKTKKKLDAGSIPAQTRRNEVSSHIEDRKGKSKAKEENKNSKKKTKRKLDDGSSSAQTRINEVRNKKSTAEEENNNSKKKTRKKLDYEKSPAWSGRKEESSASREISSLKKSRSGRKLLPAMEFWRNQTPVYDIHRNLISIASPSPDA